MEPTTTVVLEDCESCKGFGKYRNICGVQVACGNCNGKGRIIINPCPYCEGKMYYCNEEGKKIHCKKCFYCY